MIASSIRNLLRPNWEKITPCLLNCAKLPMKQRWFEIGPREKIDQQNAAQAIPGSMIDRLRKKAIARYLSLQSFMTSVRNEIELILSINLVVSNNQSWCNDQISMNFEVIEAQKETADESSNHRSQGSRINNQQSIWTWTNDRDQVITGNKSETLL